MDTSTALEILKAYSCTQVKIPASATEKAELRQALLEITQLCDYEILGICADNLPQAIASLGQYLAAMGYTNAGAIPEDVPVQGGIYLKYNTQRQSHYLDSYNGSYRGVLVSCQTDNEMLMGTYGHFPLDLFS